jgi:hypothetical protein
MLRTARATRALWALNGLMAVAAFLAFRTPYVGDVRSYLGLADGILHGKYSMWWWLPMDVPDTFRNPGYPLFIAALRAITKDMLLLQAAQFVLYGLSMYFVTRTIPALGGGRLALNLFLLLVLPSFSIAYYNTSVNPETLTMFFITAFVMVETSWQAGWKRAVVMALLAGAAFQCRSTVMLFPFAWVLARWFFGPRPQPWRSHALFLSVYLATMVPYAMWNQRHHGMFRPTPLEGGGGVIHMGWWAGKIPGHTEHWYWGNFAIREMFDFTPPDSVAANVARYEAEWAAIDSSLKPLMNATDSTVMREAERTGQVITHSTAYTEAREKALTKAAWHHALADPWYTLKWKAYSAVRLWVSGIDMDKLGRASMAGKLAVLYPFVSSLVIFLLALMLIPWAIVRQRPLLTRWLPLLLWLVYFGAIFIPFAIQARYTVPVRFFLLALIALATEQLVQVAGKDAKASPVRAARSAQG